MVTNGDHINLIAEDDNKIDQCYNDCSDEEALSFCDLPIYSGSFGSNDRYFSATNQTSSVNGEDDPFEFFSQELSITSAENIIFCGKLLPYKIPSTPSVKSPNFNEISPKQQSIPKMTASKKGNSVKKVSIMSRKSRWNLFMFGLARFPTEMELSDIKRRQLRRSQTSSSSYSSSLDEADEGKKVKTETTVKGRGLWRLLKALGCCRTSHAANGVVTASLGCFQRL